MPPSRFPKSISWDFPINVPAIGVPFLETTNSQNLEIYFLELRILSSY
jgi:hypothetical protein